MEKLKEAINDIVNEYNLTAENIDAYKNMCDDNYSWYAHYRGTMDGLLQSLQYLSYQFDFEINKEENTISVCWK